jgi:hypothetical protein
MAELVGCLAMSHSPMLLTTPDKWHLMPDRIKPPPERPELAIRTRACGAASEVGEMQQGDRQTPSEA